MEYLDDDLHLKDDEEYLQSPFIYRSQARVSRLNKGELTWLRDERVKELKMWSIIREIFTYFCFLSLLYAVTYSNINPNQFNQVNHLRKFILNSRQIDQDYTKV
jgi:hypothetical protein